MYEELEKAQKEREERRVRRKKKDEQREASREAEAMAAYKGKLIDCDICAEERAPTRMASCNTKEKHTYCFVCVRMHIETIIGDGKHAVNCMAADCKGHYPREVLEQVVDEAILARMDRLQQNADLKGIQGIEECPFCNFKAFCETPPRFDCQNPECEMRSCLKCKSEAHGSLSCSIYAKKKKEEQGESKGVRLRHLVEEAMTEALLRYCPQCKTPFTKEQGCNKMSCPCGLMSCYVCGAAPIDVNHFGDGRCPHFESTEARHDAEVKKAEKAAIEKVKQENPGVTDEDLKVAMSDDIKKDDKRRQEQEKRVLRGLDWDFGMPVEGDDHQAPAREMLDGPLMPGRDGWEDDFLDDFEFMQLARGGQPFNVLVPPLPGFRGFWAMHQPQIGPARGELFMRQEFMFNQPGRTGVTVRQAAAAQRRADEARAAARTAALARNRRGPGAPHWG